MIMLVMWPLLCLQVSLTRGWDANEVLDLLFDETLGIEKEFNLTVGMHVSDWSIGDEGLFVMAVNRINNQSDLLNHRIDLIVKDDKGSVEDAFVKGLELSGVELAEEQQHIKLVDFLFGRSYSGPTMSIASVSQWYKTPHMSCSATHATLSDKGVYTAFSRTIPSDATQGCAWATAGSFFGWTNVGVISSKTKYGLGLAETFTECAPTWNVTIMLEISFDIGVTDHRSRLQPIHNVDIFVFFIAMHNDNAQKLVDSLKAEHLIGYPYVWISGDTIGSELEDWNQGRLPGIIFTVPYQPVENSKEMLALKESWSNIIVLLQENEMNYTNQSTWGTYAPYCWDVALVLKEYLRWFNETYPGESMQNFTGTSGNYTDFLVSFPGVEGASGELEFDDNLDPAVYKWTLMNCDKEGCYKIGVTSSDGVELYSDLYEDSAEVYWPSGKSGFSNRPPDHKRVELSWIYVDDHVRVVYAVFCGFTLLVIFLLMALTHKYREHAIVKMTSYRINILMLCGLAVALLSYSWVLFDEKHHSTETLDLCCGLSVGTFFTGFSIFIGSIYTKMYRIQCIFHPSRKSDLKSVVISDKTIIWIVGLFTLTNLAIVIVTAIFWPFRRVIVYWGDVYATDDRLVFVQDVFGGCSSENPLPGQIALFAVNGYLLSCGAKWAWQTRTLPSRYASMNESVQAGYIFMFIFLITGFLLISFTSVIWKPNEKFYIIFFSYLLVSWFTICCHFIYNFYKIWHFRERSSEAEDTIEFQSITGLTGGEWITVQCVKCKEKFTRLSPICPKCDPSRENEVPPKLREYKPRETERKSMHILKMTTDELLAYELSELSPQVSPGSLKTKSLSEKNRSSSPFFFLE